MVTCTFMCYGDIEIFTKFTTKKKKYKSAAHRQVKKNPTEIKENITLGCNYVI